MGNVAYMYWDGQKNIYVGLPLKVLQSKIMCRQNKYDVELYTQKFNLEN